MSTTLKAKRLKTAQDIGAETPLGAQAKADAAQAAANALSASADAKIKADAALDATQKANAAKVAAESTAQTLSELAKNQALVAAASDATGKANAAQTAAEAVAKAQAAAAKAEAISSAIADATTKSNKAKTEAISAAALDAQTKADLAKAAAINIAATDAQNKANTAKNSAISAAATDAQTKADLAKAAAISAASTDAQTKADLAKAAAISAASTDAQTKADLARAAAISTASTDAQTKADLAKAAAISAASTDAQAKANAAKSAAISTASTDAQAKADAAKAAALNLAAADAKSKADLAKNDAISAAAADAQTKADLAKAAAISAASTDATNKSNAAKSSAIATAATDATSKSADALAQSKDFTFDSVKKWTQKALVSATVSAELLYNDGTPLPAKFPNTTAVNSKFFVTAITTGTGSVTRLTGILQYSGTEWKWEETSSLGTGSNHPRIDIVGGKPMYSTSHANGYTVSVIIEWANVSTHIVTADFIQAGAVRADSIEAGAIIAGKLAANSVATANLIANAITADKIVAGAIIAGKLAANSVATANLVANAVTADKIVAGAVIAGKLAANSVVTANLVANAITSDKIVAGAIIAGKLAADSVVAANISAGEIGASHLAAGSVVAGKIAAGAIVAADIKSGTITGAQIAANAITTTQLAANSVTAVAIATNAITATKIAAGQINTSHIIAGSITAALLAADSVTAASIKAGSIAASHLAANSVLAVSIKAGQISTAHIVAGAVTTDILAANAITASKIAANAITASAIAAGAIGTDHLSAGSVSTAKIAAGAITAAQIATGTITATQIATNAITADKILAGAIVAGKLAANAVVASNIAANAITAAHISAGSVGASQIASNAIIAVKIAAGAITADKIAANQIQSNHIISGAVTADKMSVTELSAISASLGEVVGGVFRTAAIGEARAEMASPSYGSYWFAAFKKGEQTPVFSVNRDGSLGMAGGTIKEYMIDPTFLETVYRIKKDDVSGGGAASGAIPSFTVGAKSILTPIKSAGGLVTLSIVGGGSFSWGTTAKTGTAKPDTSDGFSVTLGLYQNNTLIESKVFTGVFTANSTYTLAGEINIDYTKVFTGVVGTNYTYELRVLATSKIVTTYKSQFQIVSFSANEPVVGNQAPVDWGAVVNKPYLQTVQDAFGYRGLLDMNNAPDSWVRTTKAGIIPYQSGVTSSLGTSSWKFATAYINTVYGNLSGNADSANRLATPRTINGVAFDGTANITIADNTKFGNAIAVITSNDWNTVLAQGAYPVANATGANKPDGYGYGTALNFSNSAATSGVKAQVYFPHNMSDVGNTSDAYLPRYRSGYNSDFGRWRTLASTDWANANLVGKAGDSMSGALTLNSPNAYSATAVTGLTRAPLIFPNVNVGTTSKFLPMTHMTAQYSSGYVTHLNTGLYKSVNSWGDTSTGYYIALGGSDSNPTSNWLMTYSGHLSHTSGAISTQAIIASGAITAALFIGPVSGNASSATLLQTARTIGISGAVTGTATSFNGGANITINATAVNASNLSSGTVPDARISGSYTGMANLTGSGTVDFAKFLGNASDTVAAPSFSWTGDTNTGMYWVAADQVGISTGGVQRALFNSNGITASTFNGALNGNASTATKLATARTIALSGDATGSVSFDGSGNVTIPVVVADNSHNHTNYLANNANGSVTGYLQANGFVNSGTGAISIFNPHNANYATSTATVTGAIRIRLPLRASSTMLRMVVRVYDYADNQGFDVVCGGYNYSAGNWTNCFAYILSSTYANRNFNVRFCRDATYDYICIGETNTVWNYPQVAVTQFSAGFGNYSAEQWNDNWNIDISTTMPTVHVTKSNTELGRYVDGNLTVHAGNYNNYAPTKTGGGASGSWGIAITGNAATATVLQTARTINGVSFNGSSNITVADSTKLPLTGGTLTGTVVYNNQPDWRAFTMGRTGDKNDHFMVGRADASSPNTMALHIPSRVYTVDGGYAYLGVFSSGAAKLFTIQGETGNVWAKGSITAPTFSGPLTGNATTATTLQTARTIAISGAVTGTATSFNGGANITIAATALNASNLSAGTVPDARISGSYTGMANLTGSGTVDFAKFLGNAGDSASAPSFSWTGDTNTGIYQPAADQIGFATGGVSRGVFDSAGLDSLRVRTTGTGNDFHLGGVEIRGNGTTDTVYPTLGFHQPGKYAASIQLRGASDFRFYAQGAAAYANVTAGNVVANGTVHANGGLVQDGNVILNGSDTWLRTTGATGWYSATYGGGMYMADTTWVRTYGGKKFFVENSSEDAIYTSGGVTSLGPMKAKSWGTGNVGAKVMTWDDFLPANPPAGLQGVITSNWLAAGVIQAKHLQVDGIAVNGGVRTSFKLQPSANVPIRFSVIDANNNLIEDIFAIDNLGNGFFKGKLSKNTVDINAIDEETRKMINPYYLSSAVGSKQELTATASMTSGALVSLPAITSNRKTNVSWKLNLGSETYSSTGVMDFSSFQWRVDIYRGQTTTAVFSKTYTGYSSTVWDQATAKFKTVISLNIEDFYTDTDPAAAKIFSMRVTKISGSTNAISRLYFGADSPNFITNDLGGSDATGFSWTDKESGFTIKSGTVSVPANKTINVTYARAFTTPYSCSATAVSLMTNEWASASNGIMYAGGISITNHADRTTTINWMATGYTG